MNKTFTKRVILSAVCALFCLVSAVMAILFAQSKVTAFAAEGDPIEGMALSLQSDLVVKIDVADSVESVTAYVKGTEGEELNKATLTEKNAAGQFEYHGVTPQLMGNNVVITTGDFTVEKSVRQYCIDILGMTQAELGLSTDQAVKLKTLVDDILNYGAAAQVYKDYNADNLVNAGIVIDFNDHIIESVADKYTALGGNGMTGSITSDLDAAPESGAYIRGAGVHFDNNAGLYFTVAGVDGTDGLTVKVFKGDSEVATIEKFIAAENGTYRALYEGVMLAEYGDDFTAQAYANGEAVGNKVTLSVNDYVFLMDETADAKYNDLVKSLYVFNQSALAYQNADATKEVTAITGYTLTEENGSVYLTISGTQTGYSAEEICVDYDNNVWGTQEATVSEDGTFSVKVNLTAEIEKNSSIVTWAGGANVNNFPHVLAGGGAWNGTDGNVPAIGETQTVETDTYTYKIGNLENWGMAIIRIQAKGEATVDTASNRLELGEDGTPYWVIEGTYSVYTADAAKAAVESWSLDLQEHFTWGYPEISETVTAADGKWTMKIDLSEVGKSDYVMHFKYPGNPHGEGNYSGTVVAGSESVIVKNQGSGVVEYKLRTDNGEANLDWVKGLVALSVALPESSLSPVSASIGLSEDGTKVLYAVHGTFTGTKEEAEQAVCILDLQENPSLLGWVGNWEYYYPEMYSFVANDDGTFTAYFDLTGLNSFNYTSHFNGVDFKPASDYNQSVTLNGRTYTMIVDITGNNIPEKYYGCVGISIKEV